MPGSTFPRLHVWGDDEDVTATDLNAEFDNILSNLNPAGMDSYEVNTTQMQKQTDPGGVGTEILATSAAGEFERLRYKLSQIIGKTYWYQSPAISLEDINTQLSSLSPLSKNRIVIGRVRTTSNQPMYITPSGSALSVTLKAATANLTYYIGGAVYTAALNSTLTGLTAGPSSSNTCLVNSAALTSQEYTRTLGEYGTSIPVDTMDSGISSIVGKYAAFKVVNGSDTEYFVGYVESTTKISRAQRGYFFDSSDVPSTRITLADNNVITLLKLTYVFVNTSGALAVTYNPPLYQKKTPVGAGIGDYWYDTKNNVWMVYSGTAFTLANATLAGVCAQDSTACVVARSLEFHALYDETDTINLEWINNDQIRSNSPSAEISVAGNFYGFTDNFVYFNMTADLDAGLSEASSTAYFLYITDEGDSVISDISPYDRRGDLKGMYHPHNPWRCVGRVFNDSSSHFDPTNLITEHLQDLPTEPVTKVIALSSPSVPQGYVPGDGTALNRVIYSALFARSGTAHGSGDGSTTFNLPKLNGLFLRGWDNGAGTDPDASSRTAMASGGATGDNVGTLQGDLAGPHVHGVNDPGHAHGVPVGDSGAGVFIAKAITAPSFTAATSAATTGISIASNGGSEARPKNASVFYVVKY